MARQYRESIDVYGSKKSFEWTLVEHEAHVLHTAKLPEAKIPKRITAPDFAKRLPAPIRPFTTKGVYDLAKKTHLSFTQGAGHGGSHPHLVHEFVTAPLKSGTHSRTPPVGELDLRRPVLARVGLGRRRDRQTAGVHHR